jgi:hypothetical protein
MRGCGVLGWRRVRRWRSRLRSWRARLLLAPGKNWDRHQYHYRHTLTQHRFSSQNALHLQPPEPLELGYALESSKSSLIVIEGYVH